MAFNLDTDITINSLSNEPINGKYTEVNVIKDGRCFFASVELAYKINNKEQYTDTLINNIISNLNVWIQENLIDVVEKSPIDCTIIQAIAAYAISSEIAKVPEKNVGDRTATSHEQLITEQNLEQIYNTIPHYLMNCPYKDDEHEDEIQQIVTNDNFIKYQEQFITFCNSFIQANARGIYTYAEPEAITQILSNKLQQNICIVNNNNIVTVTYYSSYDEKNTLPTIYVKKLDYAHYHALIPTKNNPIVSQSPVSLKIKYESCEKKDLPSTGWRGSYGSSKTNRIIAKDPQDTENVVSKVNKTISEKSDFSHFEPITEKDVTLKNDKDASISNDDLKRASNDDFYFLVNLKEGKKPRGGGKHKKRTRKKKHNQQRKSQKRRSKSRRKH